MQILDVHFLLFQKYLAFIIIFLLNFLKSILLFLLKKLLKFKNKHNKININKNLLFINL